MEAKNQAKEAQSADREVRNEMDLGGGRTVSLDEAIDALQSINGPAETIAHRVNAERDDTALLVLGQVDKGEGCATIRALMGNGKEISFMIARAMKEEPSFKAAIMTALMTERLMKILD